MEGEHFVLTIIFGSFVFAGIMQWMKVRGEAIKARGASLSTEAEAEIGALRERVTVLERIVTDRRARLKEEIDAL